MSTISYTAPRLGGGRRGTIKGPPWWSDEGPEARTEVAPWSQQHRPSLALPAAEAAKRCRNAGLGGPNPVFDECSSSVFRDVNYGWGMAFCFPFMLIIWECCSEDCAVWRKCFEVFPKFQGRQAVVDPAGPFEPLFPLRSREGPLTAWVLGDGVPPGRVSAGEAGSVLGAFSRAPSPKPARSPTGKLGQGSVCPSVSFSWR